VLDELELREPRDHFADRGGTHPKLVREGLGADTSSVATEEVDLLEIILLRLG
jgi:hypothetical protein